MSNGPAFRVLPGLPSHGPMAEAFPRAWGRSGQEGFVVEMHPETSSSWVGNFKPGQSAFSGAYLHPNGRDLFVVSRGQGYVICPDTHELRVELDSVIEAVWALGTEALLLQQQGLCFEKMGKRGRVWRTRRLSWDGLKDVVVLPDRIRGHGWDAINQQWKPFDVDLKSGRSTGGAYDLDDGIASEHSES